MSGRLMLAGALAVALAASARGRLGILVGGLAVVLAGAARAQTAPVERPRHHLAVGVIPVDIEGVFGNHEAFSDTKIDFEANGLGLHAEYTVTQSRRFELGARLQVVRLVGLEDDSNTPDSMTEVRPSVEFAVGVPLSHAFLRTGLQVGALFAHMTKRSASEVAGGVAFAWFLGARGWTWRPWGWYVDVELLGAANIDGGFSSSVVWIRPSAGAIYVW